MASDLSIATMDSKRQQNIAEFQQKIISNLKFYSW